MAMNVKDPNLRKRVMTMVNEIYDKCAMNPTEATSMELSIPEKKAIDRSVIKYLETSKYVREAFQRAILTLSQSSTQ
jgi:hypothetical protein